MASKKSNEDDGAGSAFAAGTGPHRPFASPNHADMNARTVVNTAPGRMLADGSSLDVSIAVGSVDDAYADADATQPTMQRPDVIVMEEPRGGLADALQRIGVQVRQAHTGVEALSLVAKKSPQALFVGSGDVERRRVLVGAMALRFPDVAVVLVQPHVDAGVLDAARQDGASTVLPWPLPDMATVYATIPGTPRVRSHNAPKTVAVAPTAALPPLQTQTQDKLLSADASATTGSVFAAGRPLIARPVPTQPHMQVLTDPRQGAPATSSPTPDATMTLASPVPSKKIRPSAREGESRPDTDNFSTLRVAKVTVPLTREGDDDVRTTPGQRPAADVQDALAPRGEIKDIVRAVGPLLWGVDDCARFLEDLHAHHVTGADVHAKNIRLVARLLAQLQARIDELP